MDENSKIPSPSRTYVIMLEINDFKQIMFKKFKLPSNYKNSCDVATWYFYNHVDGFNCGYNAFPFEDYQNIVEVTNT